MAKEKLRILCMNSLCKIIFIFNNKYVEERMIFLKNIKFEQFIILLMSAIYRIISTSRDSQIFLFKFIRIILFR